MNGVLEFPSVKPQESDTEVLHIFVNQTIQENKASVIQLLSALNKPGLNYIVESITYKLMTLILADKSKEHMLEYISSGTYYKLTQLLIEGFLADPDIISSIPKRA
ncbi:hypothetical protein V7200_03650 [Cytobacillus firmus]|uniref:Uncharacterized protein n=1 Tax=Cytobacillus firmus TaxID=1399 RepID=A0A800MUE1_CYTFI|nr:hypothetical protein [Cytobacillus firmus]KAF0822658.1 hypothetical protein KIS1582_3552 [Cytobacillus firmus]